MRQSFCKVLGTSSSLTSGYHPQSNGQTEKANQDLEIALQWRILITPSPALPEERSAHNFQPPRSCPPLLGDLKGYPWCPHPFLQEKHLADWLPAFQYKPGHNVQLSSCDLHLQVELRRLAPWFVGPFERDMIINPTTFHLKLPASLLVHPTSLLFPSRFSSQSLSLLIPAYSLWSHNTFPCYTTSCLVVCVSVVLHLQHFKHYTGFTSFPVKLVFIIESILLALYIKCVLSTFFFLLY